jgi:hypothetical protein
MLYYHPPKELALDARVSMLIDPNTRWWNFALICSLFDPWEVDKICSLVLSPLGHPDQVVWQGTKNGLFTVKSAYYLEMQNRIQQMGECSNARQEMEVWKLIWNMKAPPVLKNFTWKLCHNLLPTRVNIYSKKIVPDPLCPCFLREEESLYHILWQCPSAMAIW